MSDQLDAPLIHLRERVNVLRVALWTGKVQHRGRSFTAQFTLPNVRDAVSD